MKIPSWKETGLSDDFTHHVVNRKPLYSRRFIKVQKFHEPGIAPVSDKSGAYHIDVTGKPIYKQRYSETFGFYCERAAVSSENGWFHVDTKGNPVYEARYDWCGNYQEDVSTVRSFDKEYFHIDEDGNRIYPEAHCYAGDFKDGIAVIQHIDGKYSHIDKEGRLIHNVWYLDLDVYHKGFTRAKDYDGWVHIDIAGRPLYLRRYAMIEPFYNGQARIEKKDGSQGIIDDSANWLCELRRPTN